MPRRNINNMKIMRKHLIYAIACIAAVFSLTSCLSDDDDSTLTPEEVSSIIYNLYNDYYGYLVPVVTDQTNGSYEKQDSIYTYVSLGLDTTITVYNFPVGAIADKISVDTDLKEALQNLASVPSVTGRYVPVGINPPTAMVGYLSFPISYNGGTYEISIAPDSYSYSFVSYSTTANQFLFQFLPAGIYVDGNLSESFSTLDVLYYLNSSK